MATEEQKKKPIQKRLNPINNNKGLSNNGRR